MVAYGKCKCGPAVTARNESVKWYYRPPPTCLCCRFTCTFALALPLPLPKERIGAASSLSGDVIVRRNTGASLSNMDGDSSSSSKQSSNTDAAADDDLAWVFVGCRRREGDIQHTGSWHWVPEHLSVYGKCIFLHTLNCCQFVLDSGVHYSVHKMIV